MATIAENLISLNEAKANIKTAIEGKGQDLTDVPFTQYADKINEIQTGGGEDRLQWKCDNMKTLYNEFSDYTGTQIPILKGLNTTEVVNMSRLFYNCKNLENVDLSGFNTNNVTSMDSMFYNCSKLTDIDLSSFNTSNVTTMYQMFYYCTNLTDLDLSSFNTSNVTSMYRMFYNCKNLISLNIDNFNVSNVVNMSGMFYYCNNLTDLDLSKFNASKVTSTNSMFDSCKGLTSLDFSSFDMSKVTDMNYMFNGCSNLETILNINAISASNLTYIFSNCKSLKNLTIYNVKKSLRLALGSTYGTLLTLDSLVHTIKELWDLTGTTSQTLTLSPASKNLIADVYVKLVDVTEEMIAQDQYASNKKPCVVCESTDEGAMTITEYATSKNWAIA